MTGQQVRSILGSSSLLGVNLWRLIPWLEYNECDGLGIQSVGSISLVLL